MASSFIGKSISLISHSDIRYRGTLKGIDPLASTIQLENVYFLGTETRRPEKFVPPNLEPFAYIVFRASEVKDLAVDDSTPPLATSVHDDPAVLGASPPVALNYPPYNNQQNQQAHPARQPQSTSAAPPLAPVPAPPDIRENVPSRPQPSRPQQQGGNRIRPNPVSSANTAVQKVERAMSDLKVNGGSNTGPITSYRGRGGSRRGRGGGRIDSGGDQMRVPTTDFDFESANAKFDKTALAKAAKSPDEDCASSDDAVGPVESPTNGAYNPKASFFDTISSSASTPGDRGPGGGHGRRGGGVSTGRTRREEEREKNFVTFGETGATGLLGRGDHIAGWHGYSRRGSRPRRGAPRGGGNPQAAAR